MILFTQKIRAKSLFFKFLFSFLCTGILSILFLTIIISMNVQNKNKELVNETIRGFLSNIGNSFLDHMEKGKSSAYLIYHNPSIKSLMFSDSTDYSEVNKASVYIRNCITLNPLIHSVVVCQNSRPVLQISSDMTYGIHWDKFSKDVLKSCSLLYPSTCQMKADSNEVAKLYTIIYNEGDMKSSIIVNIDAGKLYNDIVPKTMENLGVFFIIDRSGIIYLHSRGEYFSEQWLSHYSFMKNDLGKNEFGTFIEGSQETRIDNSLKIINYTTDRSTNFYLFSITEPQYFNEIFSPIKRFFAVICLLILGIVICVSTYITYKLYIPISSTVEIIKNYMGKDYNANAFSDTQLISNATQGMIARINSLEKDTKENMHTLRNNFIKSYFTDKEKNNDKKLIDTLEKFEIIKNCDGLFGVIAISIDNYKEFFRSNSQGAIDFQVTSIGSIACDTLKAYSISCSSFEIFTGQIVIVIQISADNNEILYEVVYERMLKIQETVNRLLSISTTIGISEFTTRPYELNTLYMQASMLVKYRLELGAGKIINYEFIRSKKDQTFDYSSYAYKIQDALVNNNRISYEASLVNLFYKLQEYSYHEKIKTFSHIADTLQSLLIMRSLSSIDKKNGNSAKVEEYIDIYKEMESYESYDEINEWFLNLFDRVSPAIQNINSANSQSYLDEIIGYVKENFSDQLLSANLLAEKLSVTPQYFSKIFYTYTGDNFPHYLNELRLEKAKDMLVKNDGISIEKVCVSVGYSNKNYFAKLFKKKYGILPSKLKLKN